MRVTPRDEYKMTSEINETRIPTAFGAVWATEKMAKKWSANDLDIDKNKIGLSGSPTYVPEITNIEVQRRGEVLKGGPVEIAKQIVDRLHADGVLP